MKTTTDPSRGIWSEEENNYLSELAKKKSVMSWNEIAKCLNEKYGNSKSGKQCRERYRNYGNPELETSEWRPQEKLLFMILHQLYGNQWTKIAKRLTLRSDVAIKNYYYCIIRKATKLLKFSTIPPSIIRKPEKFYLIFSTLKSIQRNYLSNDKYPSEGSKYNSKEKIILNILNERKVTEEVIVNYQNLMMENFRERYQSVTLPVDVNISLEYFNFSEKKAKELITNKGLYNLPPLNQLMIVNINETSKTNNPKPFTVQTPPKAKENQQKNDFNHSSYGAPICLSQNSPALSYAPETSQYPHLQFLPSPPISYMNPGFYNFPSYPQAGFYLSGNFLPQVSTPFFQPICSPPIIPANPMIPTNTGIINQPFIPKVASAPIYQEVSKMKDENKKKSCNAE